MASIFKRGESQFFWAKWIDAFGKEHRASTETTDETEARRRAAALEEQPATVAGETVKGFVGTAKAPGEWLKLRKVSKPLAWRDDLSRLVHHFFPAFGDKPLAWLATDDGGRAIFEWAVGLRAHTARRDGLPLAGRSVWNIYSVVKVLLDDAVELKRLKANPLATFRTDKYLPEKQDKRDGWRETAGFDVDQVVSLTTDPRLRPQRRVWNTLAFLCGGARTGELANIRWSNWTESYKGGLGRLVIASSYNTRANVEKGTKTGAKKLIPVHPFAGRVLKAWHDQGFKEWMGRDPLPEDFIVPRSDGRQQGNGQLLDHFHADLKLLGIPRQRQYENRSTFRMLLIGAGAPDFIVDRMTHPAVKQASDWYTRTEQLWPAMCEAILRLQHEAWNAPVGVGTGVGTGNGTAGNQAENWRGVRDSNACINSAFRSITAPNLSAPLRTVPSLAIVPVPTVRDSAGPLPAVTSDLFVQAAAIAAQRSPSEGASMLRRGLEQADAARVSPHA